MATTQDPLFLLREFVIGNRLAEVVEDGDHIAFGDALRVPKDTKTAYKDRSQDMFISILSAVILAKNPVRYKYVFEMNKRKQAKFIGTKEMTDLVNFLSGATEDSAAGNIDHGRVVGGSSVGGGGGGGAGAEDGAEGREGERGASKRPRKSSDGAEKKAGDDGAGGSASKQARRGGSGASASAEKKGEAGGAGGRGEKKKEEKKKSDRLHEIVVSDRNSQLLAPGKDFSFALKIYQSAHAKAGSPGSGRGSSRGAGGRSKGSSSSSSSSSSAVSGKKVPKDTRLPIIIVPALSSSLLTLLNVKTFLCDGQFVESSVLASRGDMKATKVVISRRLGASAADAANGGNTKAAAAAAAAASAADQRTAEYLAIDNPSRLKPSDWTRVVAVVALGKDWQFKGWHWHSPVDLFTHALGVYVKWDNEKTPANVGKWNVKVLDLSKNRRHLDATSSMQFWQHLDNFVKINKPGFVRE